jgi:hypothetical protein
MSPSLPSWVSLKVRNEEGERATLSILILEELLKLQSIEDQI